MAIAEQANVQSVLSDFEQRIRRVVDEAWAEWLEWPGRGRLVFPARARAVLVFDFVARRALAEFESDPHIHVIVKKQTVQFLFKGQVLVRFKKGNTKGIGSNIETQAVLDFVDPQRSIPGLIPEIMRVEICYRPDDIGIQLDEVAVVARDRHRRIWAYPLHRGAAKVEPLFPSPTPDQTPPLVVPRHPKSGEKSQDAE